MKSPLATLATAALLATLLAAPAVEAKLYKWVDENGQTHYGDAIPPQYQKKDHQVMSQSGMKVKDKKAMPTEAELAEERHKRMLKAEQEKQIKLQRQRDRVLLDTYTTERDLVAARDARIEAVDSQIRLSTDIIEDAQRKLEATEKRIEQLQSQNKNVPQDLYTKMEREQKSLQTHERVARGHKEKRAKISVQFDDYILRFRELKADQQRKRDELEARRRYNPTY